MTLLLLIMVWCTYDNWYVYSHTIDKGLLKYKPGTLENNTAAAADTPDDAAVMPDMVGWIEIYDTTIDYPVVQGPDNVRYLNLDPFGGYSLSGSIFLDSRNDPAFTDDYSLIYGHHMEYGRMFGALDAFLDNDYLQQHRRGTLYIGKNGEEHRPLELFAAMQVSAQDTAVFDPGTEDIRQFIGRRTSTEVRSEPILALSTCSDSSAAARIIVLCYILE